MTITVYPFLLHEKTTIYQWLSFVVIWIALTFFTLDLFLHEKERVLEQNEKKATNSR